MAPRSPTLQNWTPSFCRNPTPLLLDYSSPTPKRKLDSPEEDGEYDIRAIKKLREDEDSEEEEEPIENWGPCEREGAFLEGNEEPHLMDVDPHPHIPIYTTPAQDEEFYEQQDDSAYALVPYVPPESYHFHPSPSAYIAPWVNEVEYDVQHDKLNDTVYDQEHYFPSEAPASTSTYDIGQEEEETEIPMLSIPIPLSPQLEPDMPPEKDREISPLRISPPPRPEQEQWRVGRVPGHQGSHVRAFVAPSRVAGTKRSLHEGITEAAEKVLKKPFRPPSKVVLPRAPRHAEQPNSSPSVQYGYSSYSSPSADTTRAQAQSSPIRSSASNTSARAVAQFTPLKFRTPTIRQPHHPPSSNSTPSSPALRTPYSAPTSELSSPPSSSTQFARFASQRAKADFKAPFKRSPAPSPASSSARGGGASSSGARRIAELEKKVQTLRQAVKYLDAAAEEEHTTELVRTWRKAGRNVAEMLFDRVPKPDSAVEIGVAGGGMNPWDEVEMTEEQREAARGLERNEKGELINAQGDVVAAAEDAQGDKPVDPELLGWNEDEEEWDEVPDEF